MKKVVTLFLAVLIAATVCACGKSDADNLVGTWENKEYALKWTFFSDGTWVQYGDQGADGTYSVENGKIQMELTNGTTPISVNYEIDEDLLTVQFDGEELIIMERVE